MRVQLWSYNYAPEPTGIGPVSTALAIGLRNRGHQVKVVAAHPHYPAAKWGPRRRPYREVRDGIPIVRLPLWVGRDTAAARLRQELSFTAVLAGCVPFLSRPDVVIATSPSFPALAPALAFARARAVPLVLWLQDLLPEGAEVTGQLQPGTVLRAARRLERAAYQYAAKIVVVSPAFERSMRCEGVLGEKVTVIYNPATRTPHAGGARRDTMARPRILCMGNIGQSQGLASMVRAFESSSQLRALGARMIITGDGVAASDARAQMASGAVEMLGLVSDDELERELGRAALGLVTQRYEGAEFNLPSKLMNYMAYGLPVVAAVNPDSEAARLVRKSGAGWVADSSVPSEMPRVVRDALLDRRELGRRGDSALSFARRHFTPDGFAQRFEDVLVAAAGTPAARR